MDFSKGTVHVLHVHSVECIPADRTSIEYRVLPDPREPSSCFFHNGEPLIPLEEIQIDIRHAPVVASVINGKKHLWSIVSPYNSFFEDMVDSLNKAQQDVSRLSTCNQKLMNKVSSQQQTIDVMDRKLNTISDSGFFKRLRFLFNGNLSKLVL